MTDIYTVDQNGNFELVTTLDCIIFNFCFDYDGTMWAVRAKADKNFNVVGTELVKFNQDYEVESVMELLKEKSPIIQGTFGSMAFDYSTGDLYWYAVTYPNAYAYLFRVPTEMKKSCELEYMGGVATGTMLNGMYIPYLTADSREAAGRVTSIAAVPADDAVSKNTVSWTNPTLAWNRTELSDLAEVRVYRKKADAKGANTTAELLSADNAELLATLPAAGKKGETMEWEDAAPLNGINTYYVVPCRVADEIGMPDSVRCFSGNDAPAAPVDIKATKLGEQSIKVEWTAPNIGANNGYVNPASIKYIVTRQPDNKRVANTGKTSFVDETITGDDNYYYQVQAYTEEANILLPITLTKLGASRRLVSLRLAETTTSSRLKSLGLRVKFSSLLVSCLMVMLWLWVVYPIYFASMTNEPSGRFFRKKWPVLSVVVPMVVPLIWITT